MPRKAELYSTLHIAGPGQNLICVAKLDSVYISGMNQPFTSASIVSLFDIDKPIQVFFSRTSLAYQKYGAYIVGWRIKQDSDSLVGQDFSLNFEILSQENALPIVGGEYDADVPELKKISFQGSEVTRIEKYG